MNLTLAKALGGHSSFICCFPSFIYWPLCLAHPSPSTKWPLQLSWFPLSGGECLMQSLVQPLRNIAVSCSLSLSCSSLFYLDWALIHWASQMTLVVKKKKKKIHLPMQGERDGFPPWVRKIPWRREWQPTPVFLPGKSHGLRSLAGYSLWGHKELDTTECLKTHTRNSQSTWTAALRTELQRLSIYACKLANGHLASSLSWYLVKFSKEQQTCTDSLSCFSVSSARIMGFIAKVSKC